MRTLSATLLATQKTGSLNPIISVVLTGGDTYTFTEINIWKLDRRESAYSQKIELVLDNSDKSLTDLDFKGYAATVRIGLTTTAGDEYTTYPAMKVIDQRFDSTPGKLSCTLSLWAAPDLMLMDKASTKYTPDDTDTTTVKTLLTAILNASHASFDHCVAYTVVYDSEDDLIDTFMPKSSFRIYAGSPRIASVKRLLDMTGCVMQYREDGYFHVFEPVISGLSYDYDYALEPDGEHTFFSKTYQNKMVIPNSITVHSPPDPDDGTIEFTATATDPSYSLHLFRDYKPIMVEDAAQALAIAEALILKAQLLSVGGSGVVPINLGAEYCDYIQITDVRQGDVRTGNIGWIRTVYAVDNTSVKWEQSFGFGRTIPGEAILNALSMTDDGSYFERLAVGDLYAENITTNNLSIDWIDPDGNIDFDKVGDTMDNLEDGESWGKYQLVRLNHTGLFFEEGYKYYVRLTPTTGERGITSKTTAPSAPVVNDYWRDTSGTTPVIKQWNGTTWATLSEAAIEELAKGFYYRRVANAGLTADGLVLLSATDMTGGYGLLLATDISAGHIKLTSDTSWDGKVTVKSGVTIDSAAGINIFGATNGLTTRATEAGTVQCSVNSSGQILAGAGAVILDEAGLTVKGQMIFLRDSSAVIRGYIYGNTADGLTIGGIGESVNVYGSELYASCEIVCADSLRLPVV